MSFRKLLRQRANIRRIRYNVSVDAFGQAADPTTVLAFTQIPCRVKPPLIRTGAGNAERQDEEGRFQEESYIIFFGGSTIGSDNVPLVQPEDTIIIDGGEYEVELILPRAEYTKNHHLEIAAQKINKALDSDN